MLPSLCVAKDVIIVTAEWCPACTKLKEFILENEDDVKDLDIQYIDIDKNPEIKKELRIKLLPTTIIFNDDDVMQARMEGYSQPKYSQWLNKYK